MPPTPVATPTSTATATSIALTPTTGSLIISVDPQTPRQTLGDVGGGNFIHRFAGLKTAFDPVSEYNRRALTPHIVRVRITLEEWETTNDNADPSVANPEGFADTRYNQATFLALQTLAQDNHRLIASLWDVPAWMVTNPDQAKQRLLNPDLYPEVIESIVTWLVRARDEYGVEIGYLSFNEANLGANVLLSPEEVIALMQAAQGPFATAGLHTRWLLGDCFNMTACLDYVRPLWAETTLRDQWGPLAFHSWDADAPNEVFLALDAFAQENQLELWCTEAGWDAFMWQHPEDFATWDTGLKLAIAYNRVLKLTHTTNLLYWQMSGTDYPLNDGQTPYPSLMLLQQLAEAFPSGSVILSTTANTTLVYSLAAQTPAGVAVQLINAGRTARAVYVQGLPAGAYDYLETTAARPQQNLATYTLTAGGLPLTLSPHSVTWLIPRPPTNSTLP